MPGRTDALLFDVLLGVGGMAAVYGATHRNGSRAAIKLLHPRFAQDPEVRKDFAWDPAWVASVTAPTLLLWTEHDPTGGLDEAAMLLDWLPDARLHVIADAGHWPQWEHPETFNKIVRDYLKK